MWNRGFLALDQEHHRKARGVHPGNGNEPYSQGMPESQKRAYVHDRRIDIVLFACYAAEQDGVVDNKRARMGYSPAHLVDEDGKRRGLMQDVKYVLDQLASSLRQVVGDG
eukprot:scaffold1410_cov386-Prasinococcus_capsulatus_cf.AAC.6